MANALDPAGDLAAFIVAQAAGALSAGNSTFTPLYNASNANVFASQYLPAVGGVPVQAVFVMSSGGPEPLKYIGGSNSGSIYYFDMQVRSRWTPEDRWAGQDLLRNIRDLLHKNPPAGYWYLSVKQSDPVSIGYDGNQNPEFSINFDLRASRNP